MHDQIQSIFKGTLVDTLGIRFIEASKERVVAEMEVKPALFTSNGRLHGGAIMALADTVGATGAFLTIPEGAAGTTTLESKTNFFAGVAEGLVRAEALPVHVGKRTSCWQTRVTDAKGKLVAQVTQTQMVLTA
jgi:1,4-dihydroxy-2-naphthoyl-CoA hydrolase